MFQLKTNYCVENKQQRNIYIKKEHMLPNHLIDSQTHIERFLFQQHNTSLTMLKRLKNKIMLLMDFLLKYIPNSYHI